MNHVRSKVAAAMQARWATRDQGATAVEYAMFVALIAAVVVVTVITLGQKTLNNFTAGTTGW